jgi:hypothetical protein
MKLISEITRLLEENGGLCAQEKPGSGSGSA